MSQVEKVKPTLDPAMIEVIKTLVTELRAPSADEQKKVAADQQSRLDYAAVEKVTVANKNRTQAMCPHRANQGKGHESALVFVRGSIGLQDSFIICQCCSKKVFYTDPEWNDYYLRSNIN